MKSNENFRVDFTEKYTFNVTPETELLSIKVFAAIVESVEADDHTGEDIVTTSERLIQSFKYRLNENYSKLFDQ